MIRKLARPMVASVYIADGADTILNTQAHVEGTEAVLRHVRSVVSRGTYQKLPQDPELIARVAGGVKVGAGTLLALGKAPRLSAATLAVLSVPTIVARHAFWETQDLEEKTTRRQGFLTSVALLGGLVITSADTAGKPGLKWRAQRAAKQVQQALPSREESEGFVSSASEWLGDTQDRVVKYVEDNRDDWKDSVSALADTSAGWLAAAQENSKVARKKVVKAAVQAQERAAAAYADAQVASGRTAKKAFKEADRLQAHAVKAVERAQKKLNGKF